MLSPILDSDEPVSRCDTENAHIISSGRRRATEPMAALAHPSGSIPGDLAEKRGAQRHRTESTRALTFLVKGRYSESANKKA
jgi:hypothetical protein